jgi:hypothetical protein
VAPEQKESTASIALLYESKWKNEDSARTFLHVYEGQLPRKYSGVVRRTKDETDGDEEVYTTNEGDVLLSISGNGVFISEGFPLSLARKLRDSVASVQSDSPLQVAGVAAGKTMGATGSDPGLDMVRLMSSAGMMKMAIPEPGVVVGDARGRYTLSGPLSGR